MPLTPDVVRASWLASSSAVVGTLTPQSYDRRIVTIAVQGPSGSTLRIYRGYKIDPIYLVSSVYPADDRLYDSQMGSAPIKVHAGEAFTFAWTGGSSGVGVTATATLTSQWGRD